MLPPPFQQNLTLPLLADYLKSFLNSTELPTLKSLVKSYSTSSDLHSKANKMATPTNDFDATLLLHHIQTSNLFKYPNSFQNYSDKN
jgi:hypothetical protein